MKDQILDTRGLYCPVPILRTRERLDRLGPGVLLEVLSDDPVILEDMPAFCKAHGHRYLGHRQETDDVWRLSLCKQED